MSDELPSDWTAAAPRPPLALIAGPTASGKSALALDLAERCNGVLINADASQVYTDLRILSARPTDAEMARAPHRLFGHIDGAEACTAARWAAEAKAAVADAHAAGQVPILVGGTGLYIRTLLDGIAPVPEIDADIRAAIRAHPVATNYQALTIEDPEAAARLNAGDTTRVARALEVVRSTGQPLAVWQRRKEGGISARITLHPLLLLPDRAWLMERCDTRFDAMIADGAETEVRALLQRGLPPEVPVMRAIGVRSIAERLAGLIDDETMSDRAKAETRRYAKRQYTWFANQPPPAWRRAVPQNYGQNIEEIVIKLHQM